MKSTRKAYGEYLVSIGNDTNVVVLDADVANATKTEMFKKEFPKRHIDVEYQKQI